MPAKAPDQKTLVERLAPVLKELRASDLERADYVERYLSTRFPLGGGVCRGVREACEAGLRAGWLGPYEAETPAATRVLKPGDFAVDVVVLKGLGAAHAHPSGEVNLCFALEGEPTYDGRQPGWVVLRPESEHAPKVRAGTMLVVTLLPGGDLEWRAG